MLVVGLKVFLSQAEHIPWLFFHDLLMISLLQSTSMWWTCCSSLLRHRWTVGPQGMPLVISWNVSGSQIETFETRLQTRDFRAHFDPFCAFRILEAGPIYDYHHGWGWWTWLWSCGLCGSTSEGQIPDDKSCWSLALSIPTIPLSRDFSHVSVRSPLNCCFNSIQFWFLSRYQIMYYYWFYTCYPHTIPYYVSFFDASASMFSQCSVLCRWSQHLTAVLLGATPAAPSETPISRCCRRRKKVQGRSPREQGLL